MFISHRLSQSGAHVREGCYQLSQGVLRVALQLKKYRQMPEAVQKVCQLARSIIMVIIVKNPVFAPLAILASRCEYTADMQDFYGFLKLPLQWFCPVKSQNLDYEQTKTSIVNELFAQIGSTKTKTEAEAQALKNELIKAVDGCLHKELKEMEKNSIAYTVGTFKGMLEKTLQGCQYENDSLVLGGALKNVSLKEAKLVFIPTTWLQRITSLNWIAVDIACVASFCSAWKFADTAKWAQTIGAKTGMRWIAQQSLTTWLTGLVASGFGLSLIKLYQDFKKGKNADKPSSRWDFVAHLTEFLFFSTLFANRIGLTRVNLPYIEYIAIFSRAIGLLSIIKKS